MMAAICAAEQGRSVTLLEPNERLGKKLNITGKGRCNVTNDADLETLLANVPRNGKFLYSAFSRFDGRDAKAFFEKLGVLLKTERGNRVFPVSDRAFDISGALERRLKALKVTLVRDRALSLEIEDGAVRGVRGEKRTYPAEAVILATGGVSYPATGSTGEGHRMAAEAGHTVTPLRGSLVPLREKGNLEIDLKPALDEQTLDRRLLSDFEKHANSDFCNALDDLLPQKLIPVLVELTGIPPHQKVHEITREQRRELLRLLKHFPVELAGLRPVTDAIVTSGGVKISEIDPKTMESKLVKGLYLSLIHI